MHYDSWGKALWPAEHICGQAQGRIKSLHSMHRKMARKGVSLGEIFDARALRVVVDDQGGRKLQQAIEACYAIQPAVHRLWRPIRGELDDYIFNPKPSGYQSLHSAVLGEQLPSMPAANVLCVLCRYWRALLRRPVLASESMQCAHTEPWNALHASEARD